MVSLHKIIKNLTNLDGFRISDTHFKIGSKIHSSDFFYAKRLFQNSYYTSRIAILLAIQIKNELSDKNKYLTLIGYEYYSELLLSLIKKFLLDFGYKSVNHFLVIDIDDDVKLYPPNIPIGDNAVIIVPIASTGSTAVKIEKYIKSCFNNKPGNNVNFFTKHYNVVLANDDSEKFKDLTSIARYQYSFINLKVKWDDPSVCAWCYDDRDSRPLFETDKSSLTPTLIFNLPEAKESQTKFSVDFDKIDYSNAIIYRKAKRNNEHFLFSNNTEVLLNNIENKLLISMWLESIRSEINLNSTDKVVILSPCHYSNTKFIHLVNDKVFNSSATIIHHQTNVDYLSNFKLLNENYLIQENTKIFFVDDSLISGNSFFTIYDLFRYTTKYSNSKKLTASIFLSNKSSPDVNMRVTRASNSLYAFVNINLPLLPRIFDRKPLEHETKRYDDLSKLLLHDVLRYAFKQKARDISGEDGLNYNEVENPDKRERHYKMFRATHKIYEYFGNNPGMIDVSFNELVLNCGFTEDVENKMSVMKVLSQYPFLLYKPLRQKSFQWHKDWLNAKIQYFNQRIRDNALIDYMDFCELKFLIRRAVFLGNYRITKPDFFELLSNIFLLINSNGIKKLSFTNGDSDNMVDSNLDLSFSESQNLSDFHSFLLKQYVELIYKNQWCTKEILNGVNHLAYISLQSMQFVRMIRIESAIVMKDFYSLFIKVEEYWRIVNEKSISIGGNHESISNQFDEIYISKILNESALLNSNKFKICDSVFKLFNDSGHLLAQFKKFLWIKKFIDTDISHNNSQYSLSEKTELIFERSKGFFENANEIGAFFIVSDGHNIPRLVYDKDPTNLALIEDIIPGRHRQLITFLQGEFSEEGYETIKEYKYINGIWNDTYLMRKTDNVDFEFMGKYLNILLIRISDDQFGTLGLMGYYSFKDLYSDLLSKQLLMLIRGDIGRFIIKHHKNDEFSALREAEAVRRFAYLAGHGRQMMRKLADSERMPFNDIICTLESLQYLFATKYISKDGFANGTKEKSIESILLEVFPATQITNKTIINLIDIAERIFKTNVIENVVPVEINEIDCASSDFSFDFNYNIFIFICFELLVNAKKNRFHFTEINKCKSIHESINKIEIGISLIDDILFLKIVSTGPPIPIDISNRINDGRIIKHEDEISGIHLINRVLRIFNYRNKISIESNKMCNKCNLVKNAFIVSLQPMTSKVSNG